MGIRASGGIFAALPIAALGIVLAVSVAVGMAHSGGSDAPRVLAAPLSAGTPANLDGLTMMRERFASRAGGDQSPATGGAAQEVAVPGVTISRVSLVIPEGGQTTYTVRLDTMPSQEVTVALDIPGGADLTVDPVALTFPTDRWDEPQEVTVTTLADADDVTDHEMILSSAAGGEYESITVEPVAVIITDGCDAVWCGVMEMTKSLPFEMEFVSLDDREFDYGGVTHEVHSSLLHSRVLPGKEAGPPFSIPERTSLRLWLSGGLAGTGYYSNWTLRVNEVELPFSEARVVFDDLEGNDRLLFKWYAPGLHQLLPSGRGEQAATWYVTIEDTGVPVPQPPGPPLYLRLASDRPTPQSLIVIWNRPHTMDDYYHELTEFKVQWKQAEDSWDTPDDVAEATVEPLNRATHGYEIEGLESGVRYDVRVIAVNAVGESDPSEVFSAVVQPVSP